MIDIENILNGSAIVSSTISISDQYVYANILSNKLNDEFVNISATFEGRALNVLTFIKEYFCYEIQTMFIRMCPSIQNMKEPTFASIIDNLRCIVFSSY